MLVDRYNHGRIGLAAVLALFLAACGGGGGGGGGGGSAKSCSEQFNPETAQATPDQCQADDYRLTQCDELGFRSPFNASEPADCTKGGADGGVVSTMHTVTAGEYTVNYWMLKPASGGKKGLYVGLHWRTGNGATMANQMRFPELAKARDITVIVPDSPYNALLGLTISDWDFEGNEVALAAVVADAKVRAGVSGPLVMAGASSGVAAALRFYCSSQGSQLDGLLLVAAGALTESSAAACLNSTASVAAKATSPVPVALVRGAEDSSSDDVEATYAQFQSVNGCSGTGQTLALNAQVDIEYNTNCSEGVALVTVKNGGHNWPGMDRPLESNPIPVPGSGLGFNLFGRVSYDFDATIQGYDLVRYLD
jgi:poly(3-hydroxybutyrate) depolymerase